MNNTDKLVRALIDALGFDVEEIIKKDAGNAIGMKPDGTCFYADLLVGYKLTKKADGYIFTKGMVLNIISILGDHTVSLNGRNNDDVLELISNLEVMIDENI